MALLPQYPSYQFTPEELEVITKKFSIPRENLLQTIRSTTGDPIDLEVISWHDNNPPY